MAGSTRSNKGADEKDGADIQAVGSNLTTRTSKRKLTLFAITALLNILLWSSLLCIAIAVFQVASDPVETTNIVQAVLVWISSTITILYIIFHTVFSEKQHRWTQQYRNITAIKNITYITVRLAVSLCMLWLLTCGWNMIIVARKPSCATDGPGLSRWEHGLTCQVGRVGIAFAMLALVSSFVLFLGLNIIRRPFEAHIYKVSHGPLISDTSERFGSAAPFLVRHSSGKNPYGQVSMSACRSDISEVSFSNISPAGKDGTLSSTMLYAPSPVRSASLSVFTSNMAPPPIPAAFIARQRAASVELSHNANYHSSTHGHLSHPPRLSGAGIASGFVPPLASVQYSASALKAIHPPKPSPTRSGSHAQPRTRELYSSTRSRYSRSSVSLTRPQRLSYVSSESSRTSSLDIDRTEAGAQRTASPGEIAYAIVNGTVIPGTELSANAAKSHHMRTISAPDSAMSYALQPLPASVMATNEKSRVPQYFSQTTEGSQKPTPQLTQSRSVGFLSGFSPDASPDEDEKSPGQGLELEIEATLKVRRKPVPVRKSWSGEQLKDPAVAKAAMMSRMPSDIKVNKSVEQDKKSFEALKNKPLPRLMML